MSDSKGFTLVELLVTLTVLVIGLLIAIPSFYGMIAKKRTESAVNQLFTAINLARSEAIKTRAIVTLCASKSGKKCDGQWNEGMLLFIDKKGDGEYAKGDTRLHVYSAPSKEIRLSWTRTSSNYLQITPAGFLKGGQPRSFLFCPNDENIGNAKRLVISSIGRIRTISGKASQNDALHC